MLTPKIILKHRPDHVVVNPQTQVILFCVQTQFKPFRLVSKTVFLLLLSLCVLILDVPDGFFGAMPPHASAMLLTVPGTQLTIKTIFLE